MAIFAGKGSSYKYDGTTIAEVVSIDAPGPTSGEWDATALDSDNKYMLPTISDPGEISVVMNLDLAQAGHTGFITAMGSPTVVEHKIVTTSSATNKVLAFEGWLKGYKIEGIEVEGYARMNVTIRLTTMPAWEAV